MNRIATTQERQRRELANQLPGMWADPFSWFAGPLLGGRSLSDLFEAGGALGMPVDVAEYVDRFEVVADLPGVTPEDVQVTVHDSELIIKAERSHESQSDGDGVRLRERFRGRFERHFKLPRGIDPSGLRAKLEHGVLRVTLNKSESAKPVQVAVEAN